MMERVISIKKLDLPEIKISGSCVRPNDFDRDGDIDLFIGGRIIPLFYPYPCNSFILENIQGKFRVYDDEKNGSAYSSRSSYRCQMV